MTDLIEAFLSKHLPSYEELQDEILRLTAENNRLIAIITQLKKKIPRGGNHNDNDNDKKEEERDHCLL